MNTIGTLLRLSIFGESHGKCVGIVMDGIPSGIPISEDEIEKDLLRRKSGAKGTTPRHEADLPRIMSGVFEGYTTGAPILILFENTNTRSHDYTFLLETPRPGHADFVAQNKFGGYHDYRGGGHFSGRLTLGIVAAGAIAKKMIHPIIIQSTLIEAGGSKNIEEAIEKAIQEHDSIGGIIETKATNMPVGIGEPFFGNIKAILAHYIFSIPAIKGIEFGAGFAAARMKGSEHNDRFISHEGTTATNHAGGINGGISNGNDLIFRVAVKPTSSIYASQYTMNMKTKEMINLQIEGRHDTCIALRVPVVIEAMTALALADLMLQQQKINRIYTQKNNL